MQKKTTLLFHDAFIHRSGTERININIANILSADIATAIWSTNSYVPGDLGYHGKIIELFRGVYAGWFGFLRMKWAFLWSGSVTKHYDRIIFSNEALTAIHRVRSGTETIYYAHSLPHELFDGKDEYMRSIPFFFHEFYSLSFWIRKKLYLYELRKVGKIATNSRMNQEWLEKWCLRTDIQVIYPPVNILRFHPQKTKVPYIIEEHNNVESMVVKEVKEYYISLSRLKKNKNVDKIIHAFVHMPEKNLIILYDPRDSETEILMNMARGNDNIFFLSESSDMKMAKIIGNAVASITVAKDENFSMVSIESMACGIPMIGIDAGAVKESIIDGTTGSLISGDLTIYTLMAAIRDMTPAKALGMQKACVERAREFSLERFTTELETYIGSGEHEKKEA